MAHTHIPEASPLGKTVSYQDQYDNSLLFPIPRKPKREEIGVDEEHLPFSGADLWTGYELSWLNPKGKPQVAIATFVIPAHSPFIIESKSFKLYLNSFNQTRFDNVEDLQATLASDLSHATESPVGVKVALPAAFRQERIEQLEGETIDDLDIEINEYSPNPKLLHADAGQIVSESLTSELLKSNCLVTGQPDWGTVQIRYTGPRIDRAALLRYIVSFRQHNEFHEQCVERIFVDVLRACRPEKLTVYARYTRRGGLDISPFRTNEDAPLPLNARTARQ
jgi:7-cyano-7-deazaguanine reductase